MNLLKSEFRKLLTTKVWIFLLIGTVAFSMLTPTFTLGFAGQQNIPEITSSQIQLLALQGPSSATLFTLVLGIIGITQEYRHRTATPTFLTTPVRWKVIVAKLVTYLLVGVVFAVIAAIFVYAETAIWVGANGGSVPLSGDNLTVLLGSTGAAALYGLVGVGVGALVKNQVAAIVAALGYMFIVEGLLNGFEATHKIFKFLPGGASQAMYVLTDIPGRPAPDLLTPWGGAALLVAWGIVFAVAALFFTTRREVN